MDRSPIAPDHVLVPREVLEPFALMSREGVVKARTGHVTVTTCAEYFHRANEALTASPQPPSPEQGESFQNRVQPWLMACFGPMIAGDREERNHRFLEEALELVQACGCTASEAHQLVDYVYGRPVGEPAQEVGGVMVTLAALCLANDLDMHGAAETELARIWTKVEQIRAKQAAKPKHSPLPETPPPSGEAEAVARVLEIADEIERQADCLEGYAEKSGHTAKPVPSVFHLQAAHFRAMASEIHDTLSPIPMEPVMGSRSNETQAEYAARIQEHNRKIEADRQTRLRTRRDKAERDRADLAKRIAIAVVDKICTDIIRPGPKPEERECYVMAEELRYIKPDIESLVAAVLAVAEREGPSLSQESAHHD